MPVGASAPVLNGLRELFQLCNQARYAPIRGTSELNSVAAQFEKVIGELTGIEGVKNFFPIQFCSVEKQWRATALQDAGAFDDTCVAREASWIAPALWRFGILLFALVFAGNLLAADVTAEFAAANKLYAEGKFSDAANTYEKILQTGVQSSALLVQ